MTLDSWTLALLTPESREQKVTLDLFCHSEGWIIVGSLMAGHPHTPTQWEGAALRAGHPPNCTGWGLARPLTVHGDLHSSYHWSSHIVGGAALVVP